MYALDAARERKNALVDRWRIFEGMGNFVPASEGIFTGAMASAVNSPGGGLFKANALQQHAEQYKHYNGHVATSVRPIVQQIADQPIRVALVQPQGKGTPGKGVKDYHGWDRENQRYCLKDRVPVCYKEYAEDLDVLEDCAILDAIREPNPIMVQWQLLANTIANLEITGKAFWWIRESEHKEGRYHIWPLPVHWVTPVVDPKDPKFWAAWKVRVEGQVGEPEVVPGDEIAYLYYPDPSNPMAALSPLQAQARSIVADESIMEAQRRSFQNGIYPGMAVVVGRDPDIRAVEGPGADDRPMLRREQRNNILNSILAMYRGVLNYDQPVILDQFIRDIKPLSRSNKEMDFQKSGDITQQRIMQGFGTSPFIVGLTEGGSRNASATAKDHFIESTVNPKISLLSQCFTRWLIPKFSKALPKGRYICYIETCKAYDPDAMRADYQLGMSQGAASRNDYRTHVLHLPPIQGGDTAYIQGVGEVPVLREDQPPMPAAPTSQQQGSQQQDEDKTFRKALAAWQRRFGKAA